MLPWVEALPHECLSAACRWALTLCLSSLEKQPYIVEELMGRVSCALGWSTGTSGLLLVIRNAFGLHILTGICTDPGIDT